MKLTLSWLRDQFDTTATIEELAAALTDLGLGVGSFADPAARLAPFTLAGAPMPPRASAATPAS